MGLERQPYDSREDIVKDMGKVIRTPAMLAVGIACVAVGAGMAAGSAGAVTSQGAGSNTAGAQGGQVDADAQEASAGEVKCAKVEGGFAFTQNEVDTNAAIRSRLADAGKYLCGAQVAGTQAAAAEDWELTVDGDVDHAFTATFDELAQSDEVQSIRMGCSCAGNPADGRASVNAEVTGLPLMVLLNMPGVEPGANTVVFTSADGYTVALPLSYVTQRYCPLVFAVNGANLAVSVGGTNQLWLGSTSARYFARDIVRITVEVRDEAPASPASEEGRAEYANLPNIGVAFGGEVA